MGFIISLTLFPGTVWLAKVGANGTKVQVLVVGSAFALSQFIWLLVAIPGLMIMTRNLSNVEAGIHWFAAFVLTYMAYKMFRTRRADSLQISKTMPPVAELFGSTFSRALAMPMRLPIAMAVLLSTGVYISNPSAWSSVPPVLLGALIGVGCWWGQFSFLAAFFVKSVPPPITLKSLNKIRPFCAVLYLFLAARALFLIG